MLKIHDQSNARFGRSISFPGRQSPPGGGCYMVHILIMGAVVVTVMTISLCKISKKKVSSP